MEDLLKPAFDGVSKAIDAGAKVVLLRAGTAMGGGALAVRLVSPHVVGKRCLVLCGTGEVDRYLSTIQKLGFDAGKSGSECPVEVATYAAVAKMSDAEVSAVDWIVLNEPRTGTSKPTRSAAGRFAHAMAIEVLPVASAYPGILERHDVAFVHEGFETYRTFTP